ncbi:adhesion G-protein coupled receptor D1-like isoform X1 [Montipora foliosa]|uniref:adhesion G-protein coupled receptor D1-like isoform X1 n=2 Tax=Montipora foliosa TaxID=591990 RepID=UPI0035F201F2
MKMGLIFVILASLSIHGNGNSPAISDPYGYKAWEDKKTFSEALSNCQKAKFRNLARIDTNTKLKHAKNISFERTGDKYWMDVQLRGGIWKWSNGNEFHPDKEFTEIISNADKKKSTERENTTFCLTVGDKNHLEIENCENSLRYLCGDFQGQSSSSSRTTATTTMQQQIRQTTTPLLLHTTTSPFSTKVHLPDKTVTPTTTSSTSVPAPSVRSTTQIGPPVQQIQEYLARLSKLNVHDEDSLEVAVNETSTLLRRIKIPHLHSAANLLPAAHELETFAANYAKEHLNTSSVVMSSRTVNTKHFVITIQKIAGDQTKDVVFPHDDVGTLLSSERRAKIILPAELFTTRDTTIMVGMVYKNTQGLLPYESNAVLDGKTLKNTILGTPIISNTIIPNHDGDLQQNITIMFNLQKPSGAEDKPYCVFWDFKQKTLFNGSWSSDGCSLFNKSGTRVLCTCNHLTNFAVLMQIGQTKVPAKHQIALDIITYVGCGLSLVGEVLTVIAYLVLMNLNQEQCQIRLNLVVSIAIAQVIFLTGIDATSSQTVCIFVAVSIHYFYLVGFAWMLTEGLYLYLMVVKVFNALLKMTLFYGFCWGFPGLLVSISLAITTATSDGVMSYVNNNFCWVSFSNNLVWTFAAPVLIVCLVNSVVLWRVVCEMTKMQSSKDLSNVRQGLKACVVLFPLLGMTWVFGVLSITDAGLASQYIFTILNSLQGFFIFVMHVLRSGDVKAAYYRKKQKWEATKNSNFPSSRLVADASREISENNSLSTTQANKSSVDPLFRRHQVSPVNTATRQTCLTSIAS